MGSPYKDSTTISSTLIHSASDEVIVLSNGFIISTFFPYSILNKSLIEESVPFEL